MLRSTLVEIAELWIVHSQSGQERSSQRRLCSSSLCLFLATLQLEMAAWRRYRHTDIPRHIPWSLLRRNTLAHSFQASVCSLQLSWKAAIFFGRVYTYQFNITKQVNFPILYTEIAPPDKPDRPTFCHHSPKRTDIEHHLLQQVTILIESLRWTLPVMKRRLPPRHWSRNSK